MSARIVTQPGAGFTARGVLVSTVRLLLPMALLGLILAVAGCTIQSQDQPTGTASLALQSKAPVWGGDAQPAGTDVVRVAITPQQAREIARACRDAPTELPASGGSTCEDEIQHVIRLAQGSCTRGLCPCDHSLCFQILRTGAGQPAQPPLIVKIVDDQPGAPLCRSAPGDLCFRLGAQAPVLPVLASGPPATPSPTGDPAPTTSATPTGTASPSPTESARPTAPAPSGTGTSSPAGTGSQ
jgi:hypothetical protein